MPCLEKLIIYNIKNTNLTSIRFQIMIMQTVVIKVEDMTTAAGPWVFLWIDGLFFQWATYIILEVICPRWRHRHPAGWCLPCPG